MMIFQNKNKKQIIVINHIQIIYNKNQDQRKDFKNNQIKINFKMKMFLFRRIIIKIFQKIKVFQKNMEKKMKN